MAALTSYMSVPLCLMVDIRRFRTLDLLGQGLSQGLGKLSITLQILTTLMK